MRQLVRKGKAAGWKLRRAQVLLKCDEGDSGPAWSDAKIAETFGATTGSLENGINRPLIHESREPITTSDGSRLTDHVYVREGICHVWIFNEPLGGWRDVRVSDRRAAVDWAHQVKALVNDQHYDKAERITLVCDQLNTHALASLYRTFDLAEALRITNRLELVHTPKHGSWLNIAECFVLSVAIALIRSYCRFYSRKARSGLIGCVASIS